MTEETKSVQTETINKNESNQTVSLPLIYGVKAGMTRIFSDDGRHIPVTVVKLIKNHVSQVKTSETDGYNAYQIAFGEKREKLVNNPKKGILKKAKITSFLNNYAEIRQDEVSLENLGLELDLSVFKNDTFIDVTSISKGKGFQGVMKRHNFKGGPAAHGSKFHRTGGSIGNRATPGKVFKNKKMPGHMGDKQVTVQNLTIVKVCTEKGYLLIRGSVPGGKNGFLKIAKALKK